MDSQCAGVMMVETTSMILEYDTTWRGVRDCCLHSGNAASVWRKRGSVIWHRTGNGGDYRGEVIYSGSAHVHRELILPTLVERINVSRVLLPNLMSPWPAIVAKKRLTVV